MRLLAALLLFPTLAHAGVAVHCNADGSFDSINQSPDKTALERPHTLVYSSPCPPNPYHAGDPAFDVTCIAEAGLDAIRSIPPKHRKCIDTDADTKMDAVIEMTQAEKDAIAADEATAADASLRVNTKAQFDGNSSEPLALRCLAITLVNELNAVRTRTNEIKGCISTASNLSGAKTCVDGLIDLSDRTLSQAKAAAYSCIDTKIADEP